MSAEEVETFVTSALCTNCAITPNVSDRDLIESHLGRAEVRANEIAITTSQADASEAASLITILFAPNSPPQNGVRHVPAAKGKLKNADRIALMTTIARSRTWIEVLLLDPSADFGTIAQREKLAERHVRFLAPLAYLSPRVVEAIAEGRAPADLAVRRLARKPSLDWAEQAVALDGWRAHLRQFTFNRTGLRESRTSVGRTGSRDSETPKSALQIEAGKRDR